MDNHMRLEEDREKEAELKEDSWISGDLRLWEDIGGLWDDVDFYAAEFEKAIQARNERGAGSCLE